jgi:hypothetical protein
MADPEASAVTGFIAEVHAGLVETQGLVSDLQTDLQATLDFILDSLLLDTDERNDYATELYIIQAFVRSAQERLDTLIEDTSDESFPSAEDVQEAIDSLREIPD